MEWGIHNSVKVIWYLAWLVIPAYVGLTILSARLRRKMTDQFGDAKLISATFPEHAWKTAEDFARSRSGDSGQRTRLIRRGFRHRQTLKTVLMTLSLVSILTAMGRPQWGSRQEAVHQQGIDLVLCIDTSESMKAQDVAPNRIDSARSIVQTLLSELNGNRVGLVGFATTTRLHCPLTLDYRGLRSILDFSLSMGPGTDIEAAVDACLRVLKNSEAKTKAIVIISDGENHGGNIENTIKKAVDNNVIIYSIGVGTLEGGPIPEGEESQGYKKKNGELIWTKLEEQVLVSLAEGTGGRYYRMTPGEAEARILSEDIQQHEKTEFSQTMTTHREDQFGYFLLLAGFLLAIDAVLYRFTAVRWEDSNERV